MSEDSKSESSISESEKYSYYVSLNLFSVKPTVNVKYYQLLKYASPFEICLFIFGIIFSILNGITAPISFILFAEIVNDFASPNHSSFKIVVEKMAVLAALTFLVAYIQMFCLQYCARRQAKHLRHLFFSVSGI